MALELNLPTPNKYKKLWDQNKAVTITPLLSEKNALEVWEHYFNQPSDFWNETIYPDFHHHEQYFVPIVKDKEEKEKRLKHIHTRFRTGEFTYTYKKVDGKKIHKYLNNLFTHPIFLKYLSQITGYENLTFEGGFISNYEKGHYNGPHTDGENGRIAFVYHLSKDWRPEFGGQFMRLDWDWQTVNKTINPSFNTLAIFDTVQDGKEGSPHLVSEVAQGCDNKRISFTGWFE